MHSRTLLIVACFCVARASSQFFSFKNLKDYTRIFQLDGLLKNETGNELWSGLFRDCDRSVTFSCIQKNAYSYLDNVFVDRDNVTVFEGLTLTKNDLDYGTCRRNSLEENLVEGSVKDDCDEEESETGREFEEERSPLEEVTDALRKRAVKFIATRDYEIQLPDFFFEGAAIRISPKEVDENGALVRVDFGQRGVQGEGRIFKKIRKFIQNKLLTSLLALLLIIKLIKVKFMFVIPFLFGVGTAKKLFLKLLLFFIPAFAHIFKLCSSYYTSHATKYHHHHHQIAHHHHHVPVPVPVPTYYNHHHHHHDEEDFDGYDYAHPHIQYRKDVEELKEWGIEPYEESYEQHNDPGRVPGVLPAPFPGPTYAGAYGIPQYAPNAQNIPNGPLVSNGPIVPNGPILSNGPIVSNGPNGPIVSNGPIVPNGPILANNPVGPTYTEKRPISAHNLAYSAYADRRTQASVPSNSPNLQSAILSKSTNLKTSHNVGQNVRQVPTGTLKAQEVKIVPKQTISYDDEFYGPIVGRLEEIFRQLRFNEEVCRERLVCSMYKNPTVYSPHSNLVSNELSRDPQELKRTVTESPSSQKFHRYLSAARLGQDGGDCLRTYPCHINTE